MLLIVRVLYFNRFKCIQNFVIVFVYVYNLFLDCDKFCYLMYIIFRKYLYINIKGYVFWGREYYIKNKFEVLNFYGNYYCFIK